MLAAVPLGSTDGKFDSIVGTMLLTIVGMILKEAAGSADTLGALDGKWKFSIVGTILLTIVGTILNEAAGYADTLGALDGKWKFSIVGLILCKRVGKILFLIVGFKLQFGATDGAGEISWLWHVIQTKAKVTSKVARLEILLNEFILL